MKDYERWPGRAEWKKIGAVIDLAAVAVVFAMGFVFIVGTPLAAAVLIHRVLM